MSVIHHYTIDVGNKHIHTSNTELVEAMSRDGCKVTATSVKAQ